MYGKHWQTMPIGEIGGCEYVFLWKPVFSYFTSKQMLPFGFSEQYTSELSVWKIPFQEM